MGTKMFRLYVVLLFLHQSLSQDFLSKFNQNTYKLRNFRIEVESFNKNLVSTIKFVTHKHNRSTAVANGTFAFKVDMEDKLEVIVQVYKMYSNNYKMFPIHFQVNARKGFLSDLGGIQAVKTCGNIQDFYFYKDVIYHFCNYFIDANKLPPLIPTGEYKLEFRVIFEDMEVFVFNDYAEVYVPVKVLRK